MNTYMEIESLKDVDNATRGVDVMSLVPARIESFIPWEEKHTKITMFTGRVIYCAAPYWQLKKMIIDAEAFKSKLTWRGE